MIDMFFQLDNLKNQYLTELQSYSKMVSDVVLERLNSLGITTPDLPKVAKDIERFKALGMLIKKLPKGFEPSNITVLTANLEVFNFLKNRYESNSTLGEYIEGVYTLKHVFANYFQNYLRLKCSADLYFLEPVRDLPNHLIAEYPSVIISGNMKGIPEEYYFRITVDASDY